MDMLISNKLNQNKKDQKAKIKSKKILLRNFGDIFYQLLGDCRGKHNGDKSKWASWGY